MPRGIKRTAVTGTIHKFMSPKAEVKEEPAADETDSKEERKPKIDGVKLEPPQSQIKQEEEEVDDVKENAAKKVIKRQKKKKTSDSESDFETEPKKKTKKAAEKPKRGAAKKVKEEEFGAVGETRDVGKAVLATVGKSNKRLGFHVSAAGGAENAIENAVSTGCRAFALFIRNQRTWNHKPMEEARVVAWKAAMEKYQFDIDQILPHGSYLCNPGSPDAEKLKKTQDAMLDECQRCEKLGIKLYNFHPGSTTGACSTEECIKTVAETINYIIEKTSFITLVIETMAGQGHTVGGKFEEIRSMIDQVKDKSRVGVCIDTCHIFAAGYDIRTRKAYEKTMADFDKIIGLNYLKAFHLNDSKGDLGCRTDRHENLGNGKIGQDAFGFLVNDSRLDGIPMILETPEGKYPEEMMLMYGMDELNKK